MGDYNYGQFSADQYDLLNFAGPKPGEKCPDGEVEALDGSRHRLLDFQGDFLVLEMGSATCPLFQGRRPAMRDLDWNYSEVDFAVLYVREAHPGGIIGAHASQDDKRKQAQALRDRDAEHRRILLDDFDGKLHAALGGFPNSVFIINRNGCVVFFSDWNDPKAVGVALARLRRGEALDIRSYFKPVPPSVSLRVLKAAGPGALWDFLSSLPALVWKNLIVRNYRQIIGKPVALDGNTAC